MTTEGLGLRDQGSGDIINLETVNGANQAIGRVDDALNTISKQRADLGAYQNRLEMAIKGIDSGAENLQAAESRIRDANMAEEMVKYTKNNILTQAATAMLAQANASGNGVLQLLQ
jgi:flagellin